MAVWPSNALADQHTLLSDTHVLALKALLAGTTLSDAIPDNHGILIERTLAVAA